MPGGHDIAIHDDTDWTKSEYKLLLVDSGAGSAVKSLLSASAHTGVDHNIYSDSNDSDGALGNSGACTSRQLFRVLLWLC